MSWPNHSIRPHHLHDHGRATEQGFCKVVVDALNNIVREAYPDSAASFKPSSPAGGLQMLGTGQADFGLAISLPEIDYAPGRQAALQGVVEGQVPYHPAIATRSLIIEERMS